VAALSAWLGAAAVRSPHVLAVRRAVDMTGAISGTRPMTNPVHPRRDGPHDLVT
jgi:hypothetical protein